MSTALLVAGLIAATPGLLPAPAGDGSHHPLDSLVEYRRGDLPLIVSVPHGGTQTPDQLPDRISATLERYDVFTLELGRELVDAVHKLSGRTPYMVINHIHRKKVDVNREALEGAQDDPLAVRNWELYHGSLSEACSAVSARFGSGLLIDLHGHRGARPRVELGYLLGGRQLGAPDSVLAREAAVTSIRALVERSSVPLPELVRGPKSLGSLLAREGYEVVPSETHPGPGRDPYFSGGYIIERHGSRDGGVISAIQLETPLQTVRETAADRKAFARALAAALLEFLELYHDRRH